MQGFRYNVKKKSYIKTPFGLPKTGPISKVVLLLEFNLVGRNGFGLEKAAVNSGVVLITRFYYKRVCVQ